MCSKNSRNNRNHVFSCHYQRRCDWSEILYSKETVFYDTVLLGIYGSRELIGRFMVWNYTRVGFLPTATSRQTSRMVMIGIRVAFQSIRIHFWLLQNLPSAFVNHLCSIFNYPPQTNIANFIHSESVDDTLSPRWSIPEFFCLWSA